MRGKTKVYLTVDVECKKYSKGYEGPILGKLKGNRKAYGLDYILETLDRYGLCATFFVEPFFSYKFGIGGLREVCDKILSHGQDLQLHLHPWFKSDHERSYDDFLNSYSYEDQVSLVGESKELLLKCGAKKITAFRAGHFAADNSTYRALNSCNIPISSNYNLNYLGRTCKIKNPDQPNTIFTAGNNIIEMPITCFKERNLLSAKGGGGLQKTFRHMQITALSHPEMAYLLMNSGAFNLQHIVILFHSFEFVNFSDQNTDTGKPNRINMARFEKLCRVLSEEEEAFDVEPIAEVLKEHGNTFLPGNGSIPEMPFRLTLAGKLEQFKKRLKMSTV